MIKPSNNEYFNSYLHSVKYGVRKNRPRKQPKRYHLVRFDITNGVNDIKGNRYNENFDVGYWLYCQKSAPEALMNVIRMIISRYGYKDWMKDIAPKLESQQFHSSTRQVTTEDSSHDEDRNVKFHNSSINTSASEARNKHVKNSHKSKKSNSATSSPNTTSNNSSKSSSSSSNDISNDGTDLNNW